MKIIDNISCVTRSAPVSCQIYKNKIPFSNIANCKAFFRNTFNFFFTHFYVIIITKLCIQNLLRLLF
jgi:hypothetical protein